MAENLAFKDKLVWFGLDWFSLVWILMLQSVKEVLVNLHTKFELFRCLVYALCILQLSLIYVDISIK